MTQHTPSPFVLRSKLNLRSSSQQCYILNGQETIGFTDIIDNDLFIHIAHLNDEHSKGHKQKDKKEERDVFIQGVLKYSKTTS